jgi:hypothetical protein
MIVTCVNIAIFNLDVLDWSESLFKFQSLITYPLIFCSLQALAHSMGLQQSWQVGTCLWWYQALHSLCSHSRPFIRTCFLLQPACFQANTCKVSYQFDYPLPLEESWLTPWLWGHTSKRTCSFSYPVNSPTSCWSLSVFLLGGLATFAINHTSVWVMD